MKRIYVDKHIKQLAEEYANTLFSKRQSNFQKPSDNLKKIEAKMRKKNDLQHYADYVRTIKDNYSEILKLQPQEFDNKNEEYFNSIKKIDFNKNIKFNGENKAFYKHIVDAMRYEDAREEFLPYVKKLGIKTCVYCNAQLSVTVETDTTGKLRGMYELDHFKPKSEYPFLCTSFFNLQPCCAYCNKSKSTSNAEFGLYTTKFQEIYPFKFSITDKSLIEYQISQNCEDLEIVFNCPDNDDLRRNHEKLFHISALYETQKDVVEEIVWKSKIYNQSYRKSLQETFGDKFGKINYNRFIIGNYDTPEDIHKRPLAKLVQDVAHQLKLI